MEVSKTLSRNLRKSSSQSQISLGKIVLRTPCLKNTNMSIILAAITIRQIIHKGLNSLNMYAHLYQ
ncbi:hypothetical protein FOPG_17614 [Fusarium oxysporum f. sp. conglutinans race 2 54008]|uniref:Uncharacterized protein n=1 Tax=Fusarium oxysporum f. sp. conglutinans race 2 54008 TaxID=1089457 RepID=X0GRE0_FUSOX|nr:hypothetical protein FOPG_17614 [Fusarium oxysporum f. sp. conglutinans race 2 54008]